MTNRVTPLDDNIYIQEINKRRNYESFRFTTRRLPAITFGRES